MHLLEYFKHEKLTFKVERKLNSRVRDLQDQLDQTQATKKSLENYVSFLKTSYASIFNDTATTSLLK